MSITESIKKAKQIGASDEQIIKEIIRQNPQKRQNLEDALKKGLSSKQVLDEIIRRDVKAEIPKKETAEEEKNYDETQKKIEEAKKRIKALKMKIEDEIPSEKPRPQPQPQTSAQKYASAPISPKKIIRRKPLSEETFPKEPEPTLKPVKKIPPVPKIPKPTEIFRPLPKKPTIREKLWIRVLVFGAVLVFSAGIFSFWYWYFQIKPANIGCSANQDCPEGYICGVSGFCVESPSLKECDSDSDCPVGFVCDSEGKCFLSAQPLSISPSLFLIDATRELNVNSLSEIPALLKQIVQEWQEDDRFKRLVIKNEKENKIYGLREIFDALQIRMPEEFYQKVKNDFTLFIYSQRDGNRLGLAVETLDKEGLSNILTNIE